VLRYLMTRTWMSVVGLSVLAPGAAWDYHVTRPGAHRCDFLTTIQGANTELACRVVAYSGAAVLLALWLARFSGKDFPDRYRRPFAALFFLEAGALTLAIGLLLAESATHVAADVRGGYLCPDGPDLVTRHLYTLLAVSCVTLPFVLLRALGAWRGVERHGPKPRRRSNWTVPASG